MAAILILAFLARAANLTESLWVDELHTAWCAAGSLGDVGPRARFGNQSPLFFYLEWILAQGLGLNEPVLRAPSLIAGVALCGAMFLLVHHWTKQIAPALLAALLTAWDGNLILFSGEARPYALLQLVAVLHVYSLSRVVAFGQAERPEKTSRMLWRGCFLASGAAAFYLHYTAGLLLVGDLVAVVVLASFDRRLRARWKEAAVDAALLLAALTPATGQLREILSRRQNWSAFIDPPSLWGMAAQMQWGVYLAAPLMLLAGLAAVRVWREDSQGDPPDQDRGSAFEMRPPYRWWVVAGCWLLAPLLLTYVVSEHTTARVFYFRYLLAMFPAPIAIAALCCAATRGMRLNGLVYTGVALIALLGGTTFSLLWTEGRFAYQRGEDWRGAVELLQQRRSPATPILVFSNLIETAALADPPESQPAMLHDYALLPLTSAYPLPGLQGELIPLAAGELQALPPDQLQLITDAGEAWIVVRGDQVTADALAASVAQQLAAHAEEFGLQGEQAFGGVKVMRIVVLVE